MSSLRTYMNIVNAANTPGDEAPAPSPEPLTERGNLSNFPHHPEEPPEEPPEDDPYWSPSKPWMIAYYADDGSADCYPDYFATRNEAVREAPKFMRELPWAVRWRVYNSETEDPHHEQADD